MASALPGCEMIDFSIVPFIYSTEFDISYDIVMFVYIISYNRDLIF